MSKEFIVSVEMDRMPSATETMEEQQASVSKDNRLMKELRHGFGCGCGTCTSHAMKQREKTRGQDLPINEHGQPMNPFRRGK